MLAGVPWAIRKMLVNSSNTYTIEHKGDDIKMTRKFVFGTRERQARAIIELVPHCWP